MLPALTAFLSLLLIKQKFDKMERKETAPENLSRDDIPTFLNHQKAKDITDGDGTFALEVFGEYLSEYLAKIKRTKIKFAECLLHPEEKIRTTKKLSLSGWARKKLVSCPKATLGRTGNFTAKNHSLCSVLSKAEIFMEACGLTQISEAAKVPTACLTRAVSRKRLP